MTDVIDKLVTYTIDDNPCMQCGACCETYRVSFYWAEAEQKKIPVQLTQQVNHFLSCMAGTSQPQPRCAALSGVVGEQVVCTLYTQRPEACKEVLAGDEKCNSARLRHGLKPLHAYVDHVFDTPIINTQPLSDHDEGTIAS